MNHIAVLQDEEGYSPEVGSIPYLIRNAQCDWNAVIERAQSHPPEVQFDQFGENVFRRHSMYSSCPVLVLVLLFHRPPTHAVRALIRACPAVLKGHWGLEEKCTPLMTATCITTPSQSPNALQLLLQEQLSYMQQENQGEDFENPLRFMNHSHCTSQHVKMFLSIYPEGSTCKSKHCHCSPLDEVLVRKHYRHAIDLESNGAVWRKLLMYISAGDDENKDCPAHFLLRRILSQDLKIVLQRALGDGLRVAPALKRLAREQPECFARCDSQGCYPLDILLQNKLHDHLTTETKQEIMDVVVSMHPELAQRRIQGGRLPLHLALEHGWPWRSIFKAMPRAIATRDVSRRLFPFQIAATSDSLDATYSVILQDPNILTCFGTPQEAKEKLSAADEAAVDLFHE